MSSPTPPEYRHAYTGSCEEVIAGLRAQLEPLEYGRSRSGTCGPDTGWQIMDTTEGDKIRLRQGIADQEEALAEYQWLTA